MARWFMGLVAVVGAAVPALAQDKPQDVIKKAIEAHGGADVLKKFPAGTSDMKGTLTTGGQKIPFTGSVAFEVPGKIRIEIIATIADQKATLIQVVNGDAVKQTENGRAAPLDDKMKAELRESPAVQELALLYPLLDATRYTLTAEKDADVHGQPAAVILVKAKVIKDTRLFFDKKTGYLVRMQRKGLNPLQQVVDEVTDFSDFKKIEGMVVPFKTVVAHDGKPFLDIMVSNYKPAAKLDAKLFDITP